MSAYETYESSIKIGKLGGGHDAEFRVIIWTAIHPVLHRMEASVKLYQITKLGWYEERPATIKASLVIFGYTDKAGNKHEPVRHPLDITNFDYREAVHNVPPEDSVSSYITFKDLLVEGYGCSWGTLDWTRYGP